MGKAIFGGNTMNVIEMKKTWIENTVGDAKQEFIRKMYQYHQGLFDYSHMIADTDIEKIEICAHSVIMTFSSGLRFLQEGDERSMPMDALNFGQYEKKETDILLHILSMLEGTERKILWI